MNLGKLGQAIAGKEIFDLIHDDLERVDAHARKLGITREAALNRLLQVGSTANDGVPPSSGKRSGPGGD